MADGRTAIPGRLNLLLLLAAAASAATLLAAASRAPTPAALAACALGFALVASTLFSLLHEAVHGLLHASVPLNEWGGRLAAAFFPTGLLVQRAFHLVHHRDNRSPGEQFDVLHPGDARWLKRAQWYAILTGLYWGVAVLGVLLHLAAPRALRWRILRARGSRVAAQTGSRAYLAALDTLPPLAARAEIVLSLAVQAALFVALGLTWTGWLACHAAFALAWSSFQYADHAFAPLDARDGAWNLRVDPLRRLALLNYQHHHAHHLHPDEPWTGLGRLVDHAAPRPAFWRVWLAMWHGPRAPEDLPAVRARLVGAPASALGFREALDADLLCLREFARLSRRHGRYALVALALLRRSVPRWSRRRLLRTGFCCLQAIDDLLDGDRPSAREPLEIADELVRVIECGGGDGSALARLARGFAADLRAAGGQAAIDDAVALIRTMQADRRRVLQRSTWPREALVAHHRRTFTLSVDLMLLADGAEVRARDVPELIDAFGWCSTMRDLEEDLARGLVNVPCDVLERAGAAAGTPLGLLVSPAVRTWMRDELAGARVALERTAERLEGLEGRRGTAVLRLFARSMGDVAGRRLPRRWPFLAADGGSAGTGAVRLQIAP